MQCVLPLAFLIWFLQNCAISCYFLYGNLAKFCFGGLSHVAFRSPKSLALVFYSLTPSWEHFALTFRKQLFEKCILLLWPHFNQQVFIECCLCSNAILDSVEYRQKMLRSRKHLRYNHWFSKWGNWGPKNKQRAQGSRDCLEQQPVEFFHFPILIRIYVLVIKMKVYMPLFLSQTSCVQNVM